MSEEGGWKFAQCFGDKGESEEMSEGKVNNYQDCLKLMDVYSRYYFRGGI